MLAVAALAALALAACGGGGGGGSGGGPVVSGGGGGGGTRGPSLTAGGVTVSLLDGGAKTVIAINEGNVGWADQPNHRLAAPGAGWIVNTRLNPGSPRTHRFHVATDATSYTDADYLLYGHWAANFSSPTAKPDFQAIYYGNKLWTGSVPSGTATATYTGGAAGIYKTGTPGTYGYFRSAISLSANFGTGNVTGTLSGFSILTALGPAFSFSDVTLSAAKISGNRFTHADWGGRFYGPSGAAPTGAAGWFEDLTSAQSGGTGSATLYGSFGAQKQ